MSLSFEVKLRNYARIGLIHGLGFGQRPRPLYIDGYQTEDHGGFVAVLAEEAYRLGVETVDLRCRDPKLERAMFRGAPENFRLYEPKWVTERAKEIVSRDGARIALKGNGDLGVMDDVDSKYPSMFQASYLKANEPYTSRRRAGLQPWTILDVPTIAWANKLGLSIEELWDFLFHITGADLEDPFVFVSEVDESLQRRSWKLNELMSKGMRMLHFIGGNGEEGDTSLMVGLSPRAKWCGGSKLSEDGTRFEANLPSFEVFTTPDWRKTEGVVKVTMPSSLNGPIVDGLKVYFREGRVVDFQADVGEEAFRALINQDVGAAQLGEIALVGLDSPLAQYKNPHYCTLLDENKRCHMAFGNGYPSAIRGGAKVAKEELRELGCNESEVHEDMMISDEKTTVWACDEDGRELALLIEDGRWTESFL